MIKILTCVEQNIRLFQALFNSFVNQISSYCEGTFVDNQGSKQGFMYCSGLFEVRSGLNTIFQRK